MKMEIFIFVLISTTLLINGCTGGNKESARRRRDERTRNRTADDEFMEQLVNIAGDRLRLHFDRITYENARRWVANYEAVHGIRPEQESSSSVSDVATTRINVKPLFPGDPSGLEIFVHDNIKSLDDTWISRAEPADLPKICVKAFSLRVGDDDLNAACDYKEKDGLIVYKQLENVPADTATMLHCDCKALILNNNITDLFYLLEMGYSETAEVSTFHYIYLDSDNIGDGGPEMCFIHFGWELEVKK